MRQALLKSIRRATPNPQWHARYGALLTLIALWLAGCSMLPSSEPVESWRLAPVETAPAGEQTRPQRAATAGLDGLRINRLSSDQLLDSAHLLVVPEGEPVSVYRGARWNERVPDLLRDYLLDALRQDARFTRLSSDQVRLQADYELVGRVSAFQAEYQQGAPVVRLRIYLQLVRVADRRILAEREFALQQNAAQADVAAIVQAFSTLAAQYADRVAEWLIQAAPASESS